MKTNTSSVVPSSRTPLPTTVMFSVSKALTTCNNYIGHNAYWCIFIPKCTYHFYSFQQSKFCSRNFTEQYKYMQIGCAPLEFPNRGDRILLLYLELLQGPWSIFLPCNTAKFDLDHQRALLGLFRGPYCQPTSGRQAMAIEEAVFFS